MICITCKKDKQTNDFHKSSRYNSGLSRKCKICSNDSVKKSYRKNIEKNLIKSRLYRENNPDAGRNAKFKYKYGITLEKYNEILKKQENNCAICGCNGYGKNLDVDHCHVSGVVRGLLCRGCNLGIGKFKDSIEILNKAIKYLRKYNET